MEVFLVEDGFARDVQAGVELGEGLQGRGQHLEQDGRHGQLAPRLADPVGVAPAQDLQFGHISLIELRHVGDLVPGAAHPAGRGPADAVHLLALHLAPAGEVGKLRGLQGGRQARGTARGGFQLLAVVGHEVGDLDAAPGPRALDLGDVQPQLAGDAPHRGRGWDDPACGSGVGFGSGRPHALAFPGHAAGGQLAPCGHHRACHGRRTGRGAGCCDGRLGPGGWRLNRRRRGLGRRGRGGRLRRHTGRGDLRGGRLLFQAQHHLSHLGLGSRRDQDLQDYARELRGDLDGGLVGPDLQDRLVLLHPLAGLHQDRQDVRLVHVLAQFGQSEISSHGVLA